MELENFREFLSDNYASLDLHCWMDIENFRRIPEYREVLRSSKADDIKDTYLNKQYFFGPNSPASKEEQTKVMQQISKRYTLFSYNVISNFSRIHVVDMRHMFLFCNKYEESCI